MRQDLALLEALSRKVRATEQWLRDSVRSDHRVELLRTIPGLGALLAAVVALEIDRIARFESFPPNSSPPTRAWCRPPILPADTPSTAD